MLRYPMAGHALLRGNLRSVDYKGYRALKSYISEFSSHHRCGFFCFIKSGLTMLILLFLFLFGTNHNSLSRTFDRAEHLMNDSTAQAYSILSEIDPASLTSRKDSAYYALLYSQARYKLYIDDTSDSLINIAVNYFSGTNDDYHSFLSYYYQGCIYNNSGLYQNAALSLSKAEVLSGRRVSGYERGLLYTQLGDVFYKSFYFDKAQEYFGMACDNYRSAGLERYVKFSERGIALCLLEKSDYDESSELFKRILEWTESHDEKGLMGGCLMNLAAMSMRQNDSAGVARYIDIYRERFGMMPDNARFMSHLAEYYLSVDDIPRAKESIVRALELKPSLNDSISIMTNLSFIHEKTGNPDSALFYYRQTVKYQNRITLKLLKQPILEGPNEFHKTLSENAILKTRLKNTELILVLIVFLFVVIILLMIYMNERRKSEQRQRELVHTIEGQRELLEHSSAKSAEMHRQLRKLFRHQFADLNNLCTGFYDKKVTRRKKDEMYLKAEESIKDMMSPKSISDMDSMINSSFDHILEKLTNGVDWLEKRDIMLIRLYLAGFSAKSINVLTGETIDNVYQKKTRILSRLEKTNPLLHTELTALL